MSSDEELEYECPCYKCIIFPICQNKKLPKIMNECSALYDYLYKDKKLNNTMLDSINFYIFCKLMRITVTKKDRNLIIKYRWDDE